MRVTLFNLEGTHHEKACVPEENGGLAQLGERLPCKQEVSGSIPPISTTYSLFKKRVNSENFIVCSFKIWIEAFKKA